MLIVADSSIFLATVLDEPEKTRIIELTRGCISYAPEILPYEIGNALSAMVKRGRLTDTEAIDAFDRYRRIPVYLVPIAVEQALTLASTFNIYAYDAYFLLCARTLKPSALDRGMRHIARQLNLVVLEVTP